MSIKKAHDAVSMPAHREEVPSSRGGTSPELQARHTAEPLLNVQIDGGVLRVTFGGDWKMDKVSPSVAASIQHGMETICATLEQVGHTEPVGRNRSGKLRTVRALPAVPPKKRSFFHRRAPSVAPLTSTPPVALELVAERLGAWDSSLLVLTSQLVSLARKNTVPVRDALLPEGVRNLTALALAVPPNAGARRSGTQNSTLEWVGGLVLAVPLTIGAILHFFGEIVLSCGRMVRGRSACTRANIWLCVQECGVEALPIVSLISLLVGLILAFVGVLQLSMFGAQIYVSSLVAVGMTRIMGAIMTGIILAGRTGASYAAVIGTMQVNEEIDALTTLGVAPSDFLVMPRIIAMTAMTPLLVLYSDVMGIFGGFIVGVGILGLDPMEYYTFTHKGFGLNNLWVGMVHGMVFGVVIAITGCYQGLRCGRSAEAVGKATTSAVVFSIVGIVLSTAVLTLLCNILKI